MQWNHQRPVGCCQTSASASHASFASALCNPREQRWPVRVRVAQQSTEEELLLRATNLTLQAPADPVAAAPVCCRRDHGVFLSDAYIQLMTPHVNAMLASAASPPPLHPASIASSHPADAVEVVKVRRPTRPLSRVPSSRPPHRNPLPHPSPCHSKCDHRKRRCNCRCRPSPSPAPLRPRALKCVARCCTTRVAGGLGGDGACVWLPRMMQLCIQSGEIAAFRAS